MTRNLLRLLPLLAALARPPPADTVDARFPREPRHADSVFMRMFPELPPFAPQTDAARAAAARLGAKDGPLDARDDLSDPVRSITEPATFSPRNADNPAMTAGMTFFGQFLDHDITFDRRSPLHRQRRPGAHAQLPHRRLRPRQRVRRGAGALARALRHDGRRHQVPPRSDPRLARGVARRRACATTCRATCHGDALVGDSRNDENVILSQLHVALLRFHNAVVDRLRAQPEHAGATAAPAVRAGAAQRDLALPVVHRARVPAAHDRREVASSACWPRATATTAPSGAATPAGIRCCRSSSRSRPTASATRRSGRATGSTSVRTAGPPSSPSCSTTRSTRTATIPATCAAASARRAASSTGRPSSTSATATCGPTSASTPGSRRRC